MHRSAAIYHPSTDRWEPIPRLSTAFTDELKAAETPMGPVVWSMRYDEAGESTTIARYRSQSRRWFRLPALEPNISAVAGIGRRLYALGTTPPIRIFVLRPGADRWDIATELPAQTTWSWNVRMIAAGRRLIIVDGSQEAGLTGVLYDPRRDAVRPLAQESSAMWNEAAPVWTGDELIVWGTVADPAEPDQPRPRMLSWSPR